MVRPLESLPWLNWSSILSAACIGLWLCLCYVFARVLVKREPFFFRDKASCVWTREIDQDTGEVIAEYCVNCGRKKEA